MADKVSFTRLPIAPDADRLSAELATIPLWSWQPTHWDYPHGSVELIVLRGGKTNSQLDFLTEDVDDRPILAELPYMRSLIGTGGPFGGAHFAYLFRMEPGGVAKLHRDAMPIWFDMYRVHIAIETSPEAVMVTGEGRAQHFGRGQAWTFHNQELHGFINGRRERTHLILDVPASNEAMAALRAAAEIVEGVARPDAVERLL